MNYFLTNINEIKLLVVNNITIHKLLYKWREIGCENIKIPKNVGKVCKFAVSSVAVFYEHRRFTDQLTW